MQEDRGEEWFKQEGLEGGEGEGPSGEGGGRGKQEGLREVEPGSG